MAIPGERPNCPGASWKGPSGAHPAAIMTLTEPMALILIFSGHTSDTESKMSKTQGGFNCVLSLHTYLLLFLPHSNLSTLEFFFFPSCMLSHFHLILLGHSAIHLEEETWLIPSLSALPPHSPAMPALSLTCLCVLQFFPVPVDKANYLCASDCVCEQIRTSQEKPGEWDVLVHF